MWKKVLVIVSILTVGLLIFSGCEGGSSFNTFNLYGNVINEADEPLYDVKVKILENDLERYSNPQGVFEFRNLRSGSYNLRLEKGGYITKEISVSDFNSNRDLGTITLSSPSYLEPSDPHGNAVVNGTVNLYNYNQYAMGATSQRISSQSNSVGGKVSKLNTGLSSETDEIIVKYKDNVSSEQLDNEKVSGLSLISNSYREQGDLIKYKLSDSDSLQDTLDYFNKKSDVIYAEPNYKVHALARPNDPGYDQQWGLIAANLEAAWDEQRDSRSVSVAILDTAVAIDHPDLEGNVQEAYNDFINDNLTYGSHGTHVAGIIGAVTNNNQGIAGVSWDINLIPIAVLDDQESGFQSDIAEAIDFIVDNNLAEIINLSLGSTEKTQTLEDAIQRAADNGVIIIAASGNNGDEILFPANDQNTIAVGAIDQDYSLASYSNYNDVPDILAPGTNIYSTTYNNDSFNYDYMTGTSMSAAYISGITALLLESDANINRNNILDRLTDTGVDLVSSNSNLVDAYGAIIDKRMSSVPVRVFAANITNNTIYIRSDITEISNMNYKANYSVNNAAEDNLYLVAWRDVTGSGRVDPGDYFGVSDEVSLSANYSNNVNLDMHYVTYKTSVSSLSVDNDGIEIIFE